jgi:hypothetical protein
MSGPIPCFEPDFNNEDYGEYGRRRWYENYVFWGEKVDKQMSYDSRPPFPPLKSGAKQLSPFY